jgi:hypothetical protein
MNKRFFTHTILLGLLLTSFISKGQSDYVDVVYLKNGKYIHGIIIEQIPNQSIKIRTIDKKVTEYKFDEIEKMAKEPMVEPKSDPMNIVVPKDMLVSGTLDFLKADKNFNVEFFYDSMSVGEYKYEDQYIRNKVNELNSSKNGKGDKWLVEWNEYKTEKSEPNFIKYLNSQLNKVKITVKKGSANAKYTFAVQTLFLEQGWSSYVSTFVGRASLIYLRIIVYETADRSKEVAKFLIAASGSGGDISAVYAVAGYTLGKYIRKSMKGK